MAAPLTGGPFVEGKSQQLVAVNAQGDFFAVNEAALSQRFATQPIMRASTTEQDLNFKYQLDLGGGDYAFVGPTGHNRLLSFRPSQSKPLKLVELPTGEYVMSGAPATFDGKVLIASESGLVQLVDPSSDGLPARFSPEVEPNSKVDWRKPAVVDATTFAIAEEAGKLYTVQKQGDTLRIANRATVTGKFTRPLAAAGGRVLGVVADGRQHKLISFQLPSLETRTELGVQGAVEFGPFAIDQNHVVIGTDFGRLICADADAKEVWSAPIGETFVSGAAADGGKLVVTLVDGRILWLNTADGTQLGEANINEPTVRDATFPVIYDGALYVGGADGTLHVTKVP
jgi:outer membrane protein assembly factor BamB